MPDKAYSDYYDHAKLLKIATIVSTSVAVMLVVLKLFIWWLSGSVSVLASSMDSLMDMAASLISFFAVRIALKPADEDHHFGHGKAEQLAALAQASFIAGSALYLVFYAIGDLRTGGALRSTNFAIIVMLISTLFTVCLVYFQHYVIKKTNSVAIKADATHYKMDIFVNMGVLLALFLSELGWNKADPVVSIVIAVIMLASVKNLGWSAIELLMDKALPEDKLEKIEEIVLADKDVLGLHELRTRQAGYHPVIQLHLDVNGNLTVKESHDIGIRVKNKLLEYLPGADILFHIDPG